MRYGTCIWNRKTKTVPIFGIYFYITECKDYTKKLYIPCLGHEVKVKMCVLDSKTKFIIFRGRTDIGRSSWYITESSLNRGQCRHLYFGASALSGSTAGGDKLDA